MTKTYTLRDLWVKACEHDGINPDGKFACFSWDNPWMKKYNRLANLVFGARRLEEMRAETLRELGKEEK